jgi:type IV pilus assembly protein PilC
MNTMVAGQMEATTPEAVAIQLHKHKPSIFPISITPAPVPFKLPGFGGRVKPKNLAVVTRNLATMLNAGLPLLQSIGILAVQEENPTLKAALFDIRATVEAGSTLWQALTRHPRIFNGLYVHMVEVGETSGLLDTILPRLAAYIEKATALKRKIKGALIYPGTIVTVAVAVIIFLLVFVIPTFKGLFSASGTLLPLPTRIVLEMSRIVRQQFLVGLTVLVGAGLGLRYWYRTSRGRRAIDHLLLRAPVVGKLICKVSVAKFTRTLSTLVSSGIPILDGLDITAKTAGNTVIEDAVQETRASIASGKTIAEPLEASGVFPPMVVQMISVGEQTGALDEMLSKIADAYDAEVDQAVANLTTLLEPVLMVVLGVVVGGIIIAMYLPIFKLVSVVGRH